MKAGEISVVQYDTEHGGTRVMQLCSAAAIGRLEIEAGERPTWVVVGYASDEGRAHALMQRFKNELKKRKGEGEKNGIGDL